MTVPVIASVFGFAVGAILKSTIVLLATCAAAWLLRRQPASVRHLVWTSGLVSALLLPLFGLVLPAWQPKVAERAINSVTRIGESQPAVTLISPSAIHPASISAGVSSREPSQTAGSITPLRLTFFVWVIGVVTFASFLAVEIVKLARVAFRSDVVRHPFWRNLAIDVGRQLRLKRTVRLIRNPNASVLGTWGSLRPSVLLPRESSDWTGERMRVVLGHELAHVKRNDWIVQILAETACTVYWFNPLFWIACRQIRRESEYACDDTAMRLGVDGPTYATHVLDLARTLNSSGRPRAALAMASPSNLERRLVAMLNPNLNRGIATKGTIAIVLLFACCLTLPLAAMHSIAAQPAITLKGSRETALQFRVSVIEPWDVLKIDVYKQPQLSQTVVVRADGKISLPVAQDIHAAGRSPKQLKSEIEKRLWQYIKQPEVSVTLLAHVGGLPAELRTKEPVEVAQSSTAPPTGRLNTINSFTSVGKATLVTTAQIAPGAISGTVTDSTGARIPGVSVSITELATGNERRTLSNDVGRFTFPQLSPGAFAMSTSMKNFRTSKISAINVTSGQEVQVAAILQIQGPSIVVDIEATKPPGLNCFSLFGTVKADGTPFTQADCPNGAIVAPIAPRPTPIATSPDDIVVLSSAPIAAPQVPNLTTGQRLPIRIGGDVQSGRLSSAPKPPYPQEARNKGIEGVVIVVAIVGANGIVKSVNTVSSSDDSLQGSTLGSVQQWRFTPTLLNNEPVEFMTTITMNYSLGR